MVIINNSTMNCLVMMVQGNSLIMMLKKIEGEDEAIKRISKVDLLRLPPCKKYRIPHIKRSNNRVAQWKRAHIPSSNSLSNRAPLDKKTRRIH
jgi:hypothetical protein